MESLWENIATKMANDDSSWTNGAWNALISAVFPAPQYLVIPEFRFAGGRADLAVIKMDDERLILVLEGKMDGGGFIAVHDALQQAQDCVAAYGGGSTPVLVAALGTAFAMRTLSGVFVSGFVNGWNNNGVQCFEFNAANAPKIVSKLQRCKLGAFRFFFSFSIHLYFVVFR